MANLEQKILSFGEDYSLGKDLYEVLINLDQHLFTDSFRRMFPEVEDDLTDFAKYSGALKTQIMGLADDLEVSENPVAQAMVLASMCIRYALYCYKEDKDGNKVE